MTKPSPSPLPPTLPGMDPVATEMGAGARIPRLIFLAMPLAIPAGFFTYLATPSQSQAAQFALVALCLALAVGALALIKSNFFSLPNRIWGAVAGALGLSLVLSIVRAEAPLHSLETALPVLAGLLVFALGLVYRDFPDMVGKLFHINTLAASPLAALALAQALGFGPQADMDVGKMAVVSLFGHPNHSASYFLAAFFMACPLLVAPARATRRTGLVGAALCLSALIACGGRGAWLGWMAGMGVLVAAGGRARRPQRPLHKPLVAGALVLVASFGLFTLPNPLMPARFHLAERLPEQAQIRSRLYAYLVAADMFREAPLLGHGAGAYPARFWRQAAARQTSDQGAWFESLLIEASGVSPVYAHNEWFQLAAEQGLLGLFALAFLLSAVFLTFIGHYGALGLNRPATTPPWSVVLTAFAGVLALMVDSLFHFPLRLAPSLFLFWVLVLTVARARRDGPDTHSPNP